MSDTFINIGFDHPYNSPNIAAFQILSLNGQPVVGQNSSLSFDLSPNYKLIHFDINRVVVVPEPSVFVIAIAMAAAAPRRKRPKQFVQKTRL